MCVNKLWQREADKGENPTFGSDVDNHDVLLFDKRKGYGKVLDLNELHLGV